MPGPPSPGRQVIETGSAVAWWIVATALYLSFVTFTWTQLVAGGLVAAGAVALSHRGLQAAGRTSGTAVPHVWRLGAVAAILAAELRVVTLALARHLTGRQPVRGRFVAFRAREPIDAAVDAAITLEASLAPNTYVVAVVSSEEGEVVLAHQFVARPGTSRSFPRWRT